MVLARPPRPAAVEGLRYAETVFTAPLAAGASPPDLRTVGMIAAWDDEAALDRFASHPLGSALAGGWQMRMEPLRIFGAWPEMQGLPERPLPVEEDEPVAVLTLGRVKPWRFRPFLRAAAPAEADATAQPGLLAATGFGRLPNLVSTFSLWRTAAAMRSYANTPGGPHKTAVAGDRERPFHYRSAFIRFRPLATRGDWGDRDPLAEVATVA
jgi:hypothetical protein